MGLQGSVMDWVADHRKHHAHTDEEGDPHSPHVGHGSGLAGLWHAHTGWLMETHGQADWKKYAGELYEDPGMRRIGRMFPWLALASIGIPTLLGWALHGYTLEGALRGLVWGGLVRAFFLHHVTWSINSVCHYFGDAPVRDRGQVDQRVVDRAALDGRGVAPQPPRLPALGRARPQALGDRPVRAASSAGWRRSGWRGTWCGSRPSARPRSWSARPRRPPPRLRAEREPAGVS